MRLKVISDGTAHGTKVTRSDTGEIVGMVQAVDIHLDAQHHLTVATIKATKTEFIFEANFVKREEILKEFLDWMNQKGLLGYFPIDKRDEMVQSHLKALEVKDPDAAA